MAVRLRSLVIWCLRQQERCHQRPSRRMPKAQTGFLQKGQIPLYASLFFLVRQPFFDAFDRVLIFLSSCVL